MTQLTSLLPESQPVKQGADYVDVRINLDALRQSIRNWQEFERAVKDSDALSLLQAQLPAFARQATVGAQLDWNKKQQSTAAALQAAPSKHAPVVAAEEPDAPDARAVYYSTSRNPSSFANVLDERLLLRIHAADKAARVAEKLRTEHEKIVQDRAAAAAVEAANQPPPVDRKRDVTEDAEQDAEEGGDGGDGSHEGVKKTKKQLREEAAQRKADRERLHSVLVAELASSTEQSRLAHAFSMMYLRVPLRSILV